MMQKKSSVVRTDYLGRRTVSMASDVATTAVCAIPTLVPNRVQRWRVDQVVAVVRVLPRDSGDVRKIY